MINFNKKRGEIYRLNRYLNGNLINLAQNIFIIHRIDFWKTGGYDEDLAGNHGYDDLIVTGNYKNPNTPSLFNNAKLKFIKTNINMETIIKYATGSKEHRKRMEETKQVNYMKVQKKQDELKIGKYIHGSILRFPWHIVTEVSI